MPIRASSEPGADVADLALLIVLATLWGASYSLIRVGVESIPPLTLIAARTTIAAIVLLGVVASRALALPHDRALWRRFAVQACLNSVIPFTLIAWAEQFVEAGLATILNACAPIFAFLLGRLQAQPASSTRRQLFGVACGMAGVVLIVGTQAISGIGRQLAAEVAIVAATVCYAGAAVFGRNFDALDPMLPATGSLICGTIMLVPLSLIVDHPWTLAPSGRSVLALLGLAIFSTALALTLYFRLMRTLGSVGATAQAYLRVPIGVAIGVAFLGESLAPGASTGLALVVAGVAAMTLSGPGRGGR